MTEFHPTGCMRHIKRDNDERIHNSIPSNMTKYRLEISCPVLQFNPALRYTFFTENRRESIPKILERVIIKNLHHDALHFTA